MSRSAQRRHSTSGSRFAFCLVRQYVGEYWPLVVGVHVVPDFEVEVDLASL